jgi:hypothetical protein
VRVLVAAAVSLALIGAAGCGDSDADEAGKAARRYLTELGQRDGPGTCAQMTRGLQREFTRLVVQLSGSFQGRSCAEIMGPALAALPADRLRRVSRARIEDVNVEGDRGTFRYRLDQLGPDGRTTPVRIDGRVAREGGRWKVSCCVPGQQPEGLGGG